MYFNIEKYQITVYLQKVKKSQSIVSENSYISKKTISQTKQGSETEMNIFAVDESNSEITTTATEREKRDRECKEPERGIRCRRCRR